MRALEKIVEAREKYGPTFNIHFNLDASGVKAVAFAWPGNEVYGAPLFNVTVRRVVLRFNCEELWVEAIDAAITEVLASAEKEVAQGVVKSYMCKPREYAPDPGIVQVERMARLTQALDSWPQVQIGEKGDWWPEDERHAWYLVTSEINLDVLIGRLTSVESWIGDPCYPDRYPALVMPYGDNNSDYLQVLERDTVLAMTVLLCGEGDQT